MSKYVLKINPMTNALEYQSSERPIPFTYKTDKADAFANMHVGDKIFICYEEDILKAEMLMEVGRVVSSDTIELKKLLEVSDGAELNEDTVEKLQTSVIAEISDDEGKNLLAKMVSTFSDGANVEVAAEDEEQPIRFHTGYKSTFALNRILFGAPGTGKSFTLNQGKDQLLANGGEYERVTFHPDYSYANFVGTYKPVMVSDHSLSVLDKDTQKVISVLTDKSKTAQEKYDLLYDTFKDDGITRLPILLGLYTDEDFKTKKLDGSAAANENSVEKNHGRAIRKYINLITGIEKSSDISYEYVPGPFMRMYVKALKNAKTDNPKPHLLIIEEINRANVAAVFGDIFQLLDRGDDSASGYPIQASEDIKKYLAKELGGKPDDYSEIRIPDNMFIWATMNSADQGVFPMDTAFKRRWDFTYLGIDESEGGIQGKKVVLGIGANGRLVEWNELRKAINNELLTYKINEDKLIGPYFLSNNAFSNGDVIDANEFCRIFKSKIIMYLFDDAAKQKRITLFSGCEEQSRNQYSKICAEFDIKGVNIFCDNIRNKFVDSPKDPIE